MKKRILLFVSALLAAVGAWAQASITVESLPYNAIGTDATLSMNLCNERTVKSFQADITLPDFITFDNVAPQVTAQAAAFDIAYRRISEHQMRIVVSSGSNGKLLPDSAAQVVTFNVAVAQIENAADEVIKVTQAAAVLENYRMVEMPDTAFWALTKKPSFIIRYVIDGTEFYRDTLMQGETIPLLDSIPSKEGHTFSGWSEIPETMPAGDVMVTGTFTVNRYRLTYTLDGEEYSVDSIAYGTPLIQKDAPTKEGHTFSGWSELPATMPAGDVTVTGSFTINKYLLAFVLDGDTIATDSVTYGMSFTIPELPAKEGYTFSGWGEVPEVMPAEDVVLIGEYRLNEEQTDAQGLTYRLSDARDAFAVSGYTADLVAEVKIPETLYGLPVNAVQDKALYGAVGLETITVPASVSQVGTQAFGGCHNLLVMEWDAMVSLRAECFDEAESYGNMLVFANAETDFTGNVVVNGVADEITLTDGLPFRNPKAFTAKRISYSREFTKQTRIGVAGGWEGIVLPFDVQRIISEEKGELQPFGQSDFTNALPCWIAEMKEDATFGLVDKISANRPFIMEVPNSDEYEEVYNIEGTVIFTSGDVTVHATEVQSATSESGFLFTGAYEGVGATPYVYALNDEEYTGADGSLFLPGGAFVSDVRDVRPFEAYAYHAQPTRTRYLPINGGMATGIDRILKEENKLVDVYTLQGVRIKSQVPMERIRQELQRGIYIINGKKFVVK